MNLRVIPGVVVTEDTPVTAAVLNQGFAPQLKADGAFEGADVGNGAITHAKLNAALISGRKDDSPTSGHQLWFEEAGAARRATLSEMMSVWPWYNFPEGAFSAAASVTATVNEDALLVRQGTTIKRVLVSGLNLTEVISAGTYRVGSVTIDAKGRVTAVQGGGGTWSTDWRSVPPELSSFTYAHNLGRVPALVQAWLQCVSTIGDAGYEFGDIISAEAWTLNTPTLPAFQIQVDSAEIKVRRVVSDANLQMVSADGLVVKPVPARWKLKVNLRL
jgi:hypothetical protein